MTRRRKRIIPLNLFQSLTLTRFDTDNFKGERRRVWLHGDFTLEELQRMRKEGWTTWQ